MPMDLTYDKSTLVQVMAITWASSDLVPCCHIASPGQNELIDYQTKQLYLVTEAH